MEKIRNNIKLLFLTVLIGIAVLVWYAVFYVGDRKNLLFTVFDVGQGDAIFLEIGRTQILIDGGPDEKILSKLGRALPFWDRSLDALILTHPHADHLTGLLEVLKRYDVGMVFETKVNHSIPEYEEWHRVLRGKNIQTIIAEAGQKIHISPVAYITILAPRKHFAGESPKNIHDAMIVGRLNYKSTSALLMGDAEKMLEYQMIFFEGASIDSDVLKVGHHGSKTSTSEKFLRAVSPEIAVISAGRKNRYGHPHQAVLDRLKLFGITTYRTDEGGDLKFMSDGTVFARE